MSASQSNDSQSGDSQALEVLVVRTGTANLASVLAGLTRAGATPTLTADPGAVRAAERVVLPGVGSFGASMQTLRDHGLADVLADRIRRGAPTLAVCVGLQLLCDASEESPLVEGLRCVPATVRRFGAGVRVPQLGWNEVTPGDGCKLLQHGYAYFANSYRLEEAPPGWHAAYADHGGRFVAAIEKGTTLACQFHPELSGRFGLELLARWLNAAKGGGA